MVAKKIAGFGRTVHTYLVCPPQTLPNSENEPPPCAIRLGASTPAN
jgi:hypothetical protein